MINIIRDDMKNPPSPPSDLYNERWLMQFENMRNFQDGRCSREPVIKGGPRRTGKSTILQSALNRFSKNACYLGVTRSEVQNALSPYLFQMPPTEAIFGAFLGINPAAAILDSLNKLPQPI
ncbi:MAG: hypothetical protein JRN32_03350 [Nitrososphaerota archaeon]|nr:hypothetical protein [Nitrososphaerota archaeon]MDG7043131.1 hypothetical protein [Nitrososphaerota archaeon]MDG7045836.1 hypothetical protein [Nitrososphaerota archaeon]